MKKPLEQSEKPHGDQQTTDAHQKRTSTAVGRVAPESLYRVNRFLADVAKRHILNLFCLFGQGLTTQDILDVAKLHKESLGAVAGNVGRRGACHHMTTLVDYATFEE